MAPAGEVAGFEAVGKEAGLGPGEDAEVVDPGLAGGGAGGGLDLEPREGERRGERDRRVAEAAAGEDVGAVERHREPVGGPVVPELDVVQAVWPELRNRPALELVREPVGVDRVRPVRTETGPELAVGSVAAGGREREAEADPLRAGDDQIGGRSTPRR